MTSAILPHQTMRGHTDWVHGVVHLPGVQRIITCSSDGSLRVWDMENGTQIGDDWRDEGEDALFTMKVLTMALSPNSKTVASGSRDGTVRLWDVGTGKVIARWLEHTNKVESLCWSPNGERVVSGCFDGTVRVWDVENGETIMGPIKTGHDEVYAVAYSPDGSKFATGGYKGGVKIWDSTTGELLHTLEPFSVWCLTWTSDGKMLISGSSNHSIGIIDTTTWQQVAILEGHVNAVTAVTLSRNDRLLASTSWDHTARLWNLESNLQVGLPLQPERNLECAAFSADGTCLVTGCNDTNVYVWDVGAILKEHHLEHLLSVPDASVE